MVLLEVASVPFDTEQMTAETLQVGGCLGADSELIRPRNLDTLSEMACLMIC